MSVTRPVGRIWLLGVIVSHGPVAAQDPPPPPAEVLGCYDVTEGAWRPDRTREWMPSTAPNRLGLDSARYQVPPRVRLGGSPTPRAWGWRIETPAGALPTMQRFQTWRVVADTLELRLSSGYSGVAARLTLVDGAWAGTLRKYSDDEGRQPYLRDLRLAPADCTSTPPVPAAVVAQLLRHIEIEDGTRVELGAPLPPGAPTTAYRDRRGQPLQNRWVLAGRNRGPLPTADSIAIVVDAFSGRVGQIRLRWTERPVRDAVLGPLTELFGPHEPPSDSSTVRWRSRITSVRVRIGEDGVHTVYLSDPRYR